MSSRKLLLLFLAAALISACGRKEPPKPPPSRIPAPINDLDVQQRGQEVLLTMSYPSVTLGGLPIEELAAVQIWKTSRIISSFGEPTESEVEADSMDPGDAEEVPATAETEEPEVEEPETSLFSLSAGTEGDEEEEQAKESSVDVSGRDFAGTANPIWTLAGSQLDSGVIGDQLLIRIPLDDLIKGSEEEEEIFVFGARSVIDKNRASPFSNLVKLFPRTPPAAPKDLVVEATLNGVQVDWETNDEAIGYRVYRRNANIREYGEALYKAREDLGTYLDRTAIFGERYIYTVTGVGNLEPLVESTIAAEHEVDYKDRFPPATPTEVVALAETGRVRLLWQPSSSTDTEGYWIYRQDPGAGFAAVNTELVLGSEYLDRELASGLTYRYYILAVDAKGNQSEASEEIEVRVP